MAQQAGDAPVVRHSADPNAYCPPDPRMAAILGRSGFLTVPRARKDGTSSGFNHEEPAPLLVEPGSPGGGILVDYSKLTNDDVRRALAYSEDLEGVFQKLGETMPRPDPIPPYQPQDREVAPPRLLGQGISAGPIPDLPQQAPYQHVARVYEQGLAPPYQPQPAPQSFAAPYAGPPPYQPYQPPQPQPPPTWQRDPALDQLQHQVAQLAHGMQGLQAVIERQQRDVPRPVNGKALPREDPRQTLEAFQQQEEPPEERVIAGFETLKIRAVDGPIARAPRVQVYFEIDHFGKQSSWYHDVIETDSLVVLFYDARHEGGQQFKPAGSRQDPMPMVVTYSGPGGKPRVVEVMSEGEAFSNGELDYILLRKAAQDLRDQP